MRVGDQSSVLLKQNSEYLSATVIRSHFVDSDSGILDADLGVDDDGVGHFPEAKVSCTRPSSVFSALATLSFA
ncbi:hypothetical protein L596_022933 [Steinernema carpocapsae]|uniref:Uncharacterized protein n=1 Tax=Steinernema carpocapsae TaxID=34508 RepID=A0A4U5MC52_STECR|nr:hypothetical protein L596_022933 [Steinernema carpocapsae]